jgi:hypothetical protein
MKALISNDYFGQPLVWEYDQGSVERVDLEDFNNHCLLLDGPQICPTALPYELYELILFYVFEIRSYTRNFDQVFQLCMVDRRSCFLIYNKIYNNQQVSTRQMIHQLSKTFQMAESIYDLYLCAPNLSQSAMNAVVFYREGSLLENDRFHPWDFRPADLEIKRLELDLENDLHQIYGFPGHFYGDTIWIQGGEEDGIYTVNKLQHPVVVLILCDYTYALIPTRRSISYNWRCFSSYLRLSFGERAGFYVMVKHQIDTDNPFIHTTDLFVQI